jgi:uncharacterized membrane protein YkvA (DUF1232 family)
MRTLLRIWNSARRFGGIRPIWHVATHAPSYARLMARLAAEARVPALAKAVWIGTLLFAISPLNLPEWVPVVGPLDDLGLALFAFTFFLRRVPGDVMAEHKRALGLPSQARNSGGL